MNEDVFKKTETFEKWYGILDGVLTEFLFLESFSNGLSWGQNMYGPNSLAKKVQRIITKFDYWRDEYKINYWPETVQQLVYRVQDQNSNFSNKQKAEKLQNILNQILTDDSFLVMVYDNCEGYDNRSFKCDDNQLVSSIGRGGSNVLVYRSKHWNRVRVEDVDRMMKEVESCRQKARGWTARYKDLPEYIKANHVGNSGFIGLIKQDNQLTILPAHTPSGTPGCWLDVSIGDSTEKHILIAGYK
uniref:SH3 domain-containing protein n=2 Tax=Caenorhabditis tropicalis TaxID=1561998 RepID=A0A1I7UWL9_9PELO